MIDINTSKSRYEKSQNKGGLLGGLGYLSGSLAAGVAGVGEGVIDAVLALGADLTGNHDFAEYVFKNNVIGDWHEDISEDYNPTGVMQFFGDVMSGIGQSSYFLIPYAGAPLFFTGVISQGISGAAEKTGDVGIKEAAYGLTTGAVEGGLEMVFGGMAKAGKTLLSGITKGAIKSTTKSAVRKGVVGQLLSGAASEFLEESASEIIDTGLQRLYKIDPNKELSMKDVLYSGLVGAVSGGVTAGVTSGLNAATNRARGEKIIKNGNAQTVVNTASYVADKLAASGTDFKNTSEWVRTLRGEVDAYNKLVEQGKGESASAHTILGEMQASLFFAETQAINAGITERIKTASEEDRAAMAEYINRNFDKKQRQKDFTAEDIAKDTNEVAKQLAIMQMVGSPFFNYDAAMADQAQESGIENVIAKEQGKATRVQSEAPTAQAAPVDAAFERAAAEGVQNAESRMQSEAPVVEDFAAVEFGEVKHDLADDVADIESSATEIDDDIERIREDVKKAVSGIKVDGKLYELSDKHINNIANGVQKYIRQGMSESDAIAKAVRTRLVDIKSMGEESGVKHELGKATLTKVRGAVINAYRGGMQSRTVENASKTAQEARKTSEGTEAQRSAESVTEGKDDGKAAEKSSERKEKSSESKKTETKEPKVSEAKESLTDAQRAERAKKRAEAWIEWEKKTAPTAQELNTAREYVKGFDNLNNTRRLAILRTIRSAEGVDAQTVKGIANLMAVIPGSDLEVRFSDGIGPKGLITKIGNKSVIVIDSSTDRKTTIKGTIAHELTHYLENKAGYEQLAKFARDHAKPEAIEKHKNRYINGWAKIGHKYTEAELDSEITASLVADALNNERFLKRYADRDKKLIQKAFEWLKGLATRSKKKGKETEEISEITDEMAHKLIILLQSEKTTGESKGDYIKYSAMNSDSLSDNVDKILKMSDEEAVSNKEAGNFISVMKNTPQIIIDKVSGAEDLEIVMRFDSFYLATRHEGALEGHYHNYGEIMKRLPEIIADPQAIIRMDSGRINIYSQIQTKKGNNSIVSIELNTVKDINSKYDKYNLLVSVMPAKDNYARNNLLNHGVKVEYEKEDLSQVNHQLHEWLAIVNERSSNDSIHQNEPDVNTSEEKNIAKADLSETKSQRFNPEEPAIRYDLADEDSAYMAAVERGDMETAQKMVDEAAKTAGYVPVSRYHQTGKKFSVFSNDHPDAGLNDSDTPNGYFFKENDHDIGVGADFVKTGHGGKIQMRVYLKHKNMLYFKNRDEARSWYASNIPGYRELLEKYDQHLQDFKIANSENNKKMFDELIALEESGQSTTEKDLEIMEKYDKIMDKWIEDRKEYETGLRAGMRKLLNEYFIENDSGYDGIELADDGHRYIDMKREDVHTFIVFKNTQIKSADPVTYDDDGNVIPLSKRFNPEEPDIRYDLADDVEYAPAFYSHMFKVAGEIKTEKIGSDSIVPYFKGKGVKDEEIKWSDIENWLEGKKSVTKTELQEFITRSYLQIEEDLLDEKVQKISLNIVKDGKNYLVKDSNGNVIDTWIYHDSVAGTLGIKGWISEKNSDIATSVEEIDLAVNSPKRKKGTRWGKYKLDGGTNYRELVFKIPNSTYSNGAMRTHWGNDAQGVLAHARIQDMTTTDGKNMLFIEEIQSDWHNEGQKKGYLPKLSPSDEIRLANLREENRKLFAELKTVDDNDDKKFDEIYDKRKRVLAEIEALGGKEGAPPDAPFRNNYHEFVLKRLLRMAAEEGYDSIGWTTADIQSKRWSDEYAEGYRIEYDQDIPKFLRKYGKKWGATVEKTKVDARGTTEWERDMVAKGLIELVPYEEEVWSMDITDTMKGSVLYEGQVLYDLADDDAGENADGMLNENGEVKDKYFAAAVARMQQGTVVDPETKAAQNTVEAYKAGNKILNEKLSAERKRYSTLFQEASDLNDRIYFLENQNEAYKEGNQNLNELLLDARNKYKAAEEQLDTVRTSLRQLGYDFADEKRKVARKDKQIANQKNTIRELRKEMWKIAKENAYLKSNKQFTIEDCKSIITAQVVEKYILKEKLPPEISIKKKDLNDIARALSIDLNNAFSDKGKGAEKAAQNAATKLVDAVYINNPEYDPNKQGSKKTIPLTSARGEAYIYRLVEVVQADIFNEFVNIGRFVDAKKHNNDMLKIKALQKKIAEISKEYESEIYFLQNEAAKIEESLREENARLAELYAKSKAEWGRVYAKKEIKRELDNIFERGLVSQFFGGEYGANLPKKTRDGIAEYIALELNSSRSINDARVNEAIKEAAREIVSRLTFTDIDNGEQYYLDKIVDEDSAKTFTEFVEADLINMLQNIGTLNPYAELKRRFELVKAEYLDKGKQAKERQEWGKELPKTYQAALKIKKLAAQGKGSFSEAVQLVADELGKMVDESGHLHFGRIDAAMGEVARFFEGEAMKAASERDQLDDKAKVADDGVVWSVNPALQEKVEEYLRLRKGREGKALTAEELKLVGEVLRGMKTTIERYNKEFINGHWVDVETISAESAEDLLSFVAKDKEYKTKIGKILGGKIGKTIDQGYFYYILSPETVIEALEGYKQGGLLKSLYHSVRVAKQKAEHRAVQMKKPFAEFLDDKKHEWEAKKDQGGKEGRKYSYRDKLNVRMINVNGTNITLGEAIYLYMLTKREHAWAGLQEEGFITYDENNKQRTRIKIEEIATTRDFIYNQLDKTDLEFLRMAEEFFNKTATKVKEDADMEIFGFTNTQDSYYVPIIRDRYSRMGGVTDARQSIGSIITVYNKSFNQNLVQNAKALEGKNVMSIINDHADGLADYAELYLPLKAFDRVYNKVVPTSEGNRSLREILNTKVWNGTEDYFKNLFSDIQGQRKDKPENFDKIVGKLRSAWVNSVLGANLKVVATQTTSLGAATQVIEPKYIMPAVRITTPGLKVDELRARAYKYSDIIEARSFDMGALRAQGNIEKVSKIGEYSGWAIGWMDERVCLAIFHAAELKVQDTKGYAIGTEENARLAAKIADEAIYTTQAMSTASERSAMQRSKSEIMKLFAMFTSDSVKNLSHLYGNVMKYAAHSQRVKAGDTSYKAALETDKKEIKRSMRTLAITGIMLGLITQGFKYLFAKEEEEPEDKVKDFAIDVASSTLNILPIASDFIDKLVFNYDISMNVLDVINDSIETVAKGFKTAGKSMSGEYVSTSEAVSVTYDVIKSAAEMFGWPISPVERTITGLMRRFTPSAIYGWDAAFSNPSYTADLKDAVENGDEALAEHILSQLYKSEVNGTYTSAELEEVVRLYRAGNENVIPQKIGTEINGVKLTAAQRKQFTKTYSQASGEVNKLISSSYYSALDDEQRAKAIKNVYAMYYGRAANEIVGKEMTTAVAYSYLTDNYAALFASQAYKSGLEEQVDLYGKKTTVKEQFVDYAANLGLSDNDLLVISYANGVRDKETKAAFLQYLNAMQLSADVKKQIAERLGFEYRDGAVVEKSE